jgi:hypothetical protein
VGRSIKVGYDFRRDEDQLRRWPRIPFDKQITVYSGIKQRRHLCACLNLGVGGIAIDASRLAGPPTRLRLNLPLAEGRTVVVDGLVVSERLLDGCRVWHIRFDKVPARIHSELASYLAHAGRGAPTAQNNLSPSPRALRTEGN